MQTSINSGVSKGSLLRNRARGAMFFIGFGSIWTYLGLQAVHIGSTAALAALFAIVALLMVGSVAQIRRAGNPPPEDALSEQAIRSRRMFLAVNIIQWVSVFTAIAILSLLHMPEYIVTSIAIIVALHLFPLAESFRNRMHYVTATLLLVWSLGCLALLPKERVMGLTSLGVGTILLVSAAVSLLRNFGASGPNVDGLQAERTA